MIRFARRLFIALPCVFGLCSAVAAADGEVTFIATGDVMLSRHIGKVIRARGNAFPLQHVAPFLRQGDVVFCNLESMFGTAEHALYFPDKPYNFRASTACVRLLRDAGFTIVNLANNHAMDYGSGALAATCSLLDGAGIRRFGAGADLAEARRPAIVECRGFRMGFIGYTVAHSTLVYAGPGRPGAASLYLPHIRKDIRSLRARVDFLVVSLHWGMEYSNVPTGYQRKVAHAVIDAGADLILGHHPHVPQGIEEYNRRVIVYSLGNLLFDQKHKGTTKSMALLMKFRGGEVRSAQLVPLDRKESYYPAVAGDPARQAILTDLKSYSAALDSNPDLLTYITFE